jgi:integrase
MPKIAVDVSETKLKRLLADFPDSKGNRRTKRVVVALGDPRGLCIRLNPGKQASAPCYLTYRMEPNGPVQWFPLGNYPDISLEELRDAAREALKLKRAGKDPRHEKEQERARQAELQDAAKKGELPTTGPTMADACQLYFDYAADETNVKPSTAKWGTWIINRMILPFWGGRLVAEVTKTEVKDWHRSMRATPSMADASMRILSKIFNLAIEQDWIVGNPTTKLPKLVKGADKSRQRILNKAERQALARALRSMEQDQSIEPAALGAIRTLLLTAMRLQEVLTLTWEEVDFQTGWITKAEHKSSRRSGAKKVAITPQLKELLEAQPRRRNCSWVFPSPHTPKVGKPVAHFVGLQKVWDRVKARVAEDEAKKKPSEAVNIEDVHLHDLRRTALSITYGNEGQSIEALAKVAGHASVATTEKVYAHLEDEKLREAAELIAAAVAADLEG